MYSLTASIPINCPWTPPPPSVSLLNRPLRPVKRFMMKCRLTLHLPPVRVRPWVWWSSSDAQCSAHTWYEDTLCHQSQASIQVTWSVWTNQEPVFRSRDLLSVRMASSRMRMMMWTLRDKSSDHTQPHLYCPWPVLSYFNNLLGHINVTGFK